MATPPLLNELGSKISELLANSPVRDVEKNVKALLGSTFDRLDLVTRDEFEVQREMVAQLRIRLFEMEARLAALEAAQGVAPATPAARPAEQDGGASL